MTKSILSSGEIITGDKFEELAEYNFDVLNYAIGDHHRPKLNCNSDDLAYLHIDKINREHLQIIFTPGHDLATFSKFCHLIQHPYVLIGHNSDLGLTESVFNDISKSNLIHVYSQNCEVTNPKATAIPIGLARREYPHGNLRVFCTTPISEKNSLVYKNFDINTNTIVRRAVDSITTAADIHMSPQRPYAEYLEFLQQSAFAISPPGNGIDCHRIWESLYLGTVPIVQLHPTLSTFYHLPIWFIDSWSEVTIPAMRRRISMLIRFQEDIPELRFSFWRNKILSHFLP